jgi:hypothetical protein
VVVVVVVLSVLFAFNVLPTSGGGSASGTSSDVAIATADAYSRSVPGGPWVVSGATGVDLLFAHSISLLSFEAAQGCTLLGVQNYTVAASTGNYSNGRLADWEVNFINETASMTVLVADGQVAAHLIQIGPNHCSMYAPGPVAINTSVLSSVQAAPYFLDDPNVGTFVSAHPTAEALMELVSGLWIAQYTTCDTYYDPGAPVEGALVFSSINSTTGVRNPHISGHFSDSDCAYQFYLGQPIPMSDLLQLGSATRGVCPAGDTFAVNGCLAGDYTYTLPIEISYLAYNGIGLGVDRGGPGSGNYTLTGAGGFSILQENGTVAAQEALANGQPMYMNQPWTIFGPGVTTADLPASGETILLDMGPANPTGLGLTLELSPSGTFFGPTPSYVPLP